jgi:nicotinamide mononucleotide transporter
MASILQSVSPLEATAVVFAVVYLVLAIRQVSLCWHAAFISSVLSIFVFAGAQLYMQSALQIFYAGMAVYGWLQWTRGVGTHAGDPARIHTWPLQRHALALCAVVLVSIGFAWALSYTTQAMPLLDSFVTIASILTTWMVANKLLENWIYWFVIDSISIYLYVSQGLLLYAGLFVVYLILVVIGFQQWRAELRQSLASDPAMELS